MGKEIARRWKSLQSDDAQKYHKMAANDLVRYRKELEEYQAKKGAMQKAVGATAASEGAPKPVPSNLKSAPQLQGEYDGAHRPVSGYSEHSYRLGEYLPSRYDSIASSGYGVSSNTLGHRDLATETALAQLFAQDASAAAVSRSIFENGGRSVTDRGTLGNQLLSEYPLLANALGRPGLDRDYSTPLGGWNPTAALRDVPLQGSSFTEQLLMSNMMGRSGSETINMGAMPWDNSLLSMPSMNPDPAVPQQRALEQYELLQLLSGAPSEQTNNPLGLPSQTVHSTGPHSMSRSERAFLGSNDALALQRLLLLRHQQERDLQAAMAARNSNDDILVRRLLGTVRDDIDGRAASGSGQRSRELDGNAGDRGASGGC
jgi:hypothetical protein